MRNAINIMSNEKGSIHQFDFNLFCEFFSSMERQGPGSPQETIRALGYIENLASDSRIADIGCGTGGQTRVVAQHAPGQITGIDLFPQFIDLFNASASMLNLQDRVKGIVGTMENLPFETEELDLIWSEGAIYNMGFERGLNEWRKCIKKGGYIAVTEASWFTAERPAKIGEYWRNAYPGIDTIPTKVAKVQKAGYIPVATFILPEYCWTEHFYASQIAAQEAFLKKYAGNKTAEDFIIACERYETELYSQYKGYWGYAVDSCDNLAPEQLTIGALSSFSIIGPRSIA